MEKPPVLPETIPMNWHPRFQREQHGCPLCGRPLPSPRAQRHIHIGEGGKSILRADLPTVEGFSGDCAVLSTGPDTGNMGWFAVGLTCAKKLGLAYSKPLPPLEFAEATGT